jgi:hypothetical protein
MIRSPFIDPMTGLCLSTGIVDHTLFHHSCKLFHKDSNLFFSVQNFYLIFIISHITWMVAPNNTDAAANNKKYTNPISHLFLFIFIKFVVLNTVVLFLPSLFALAPNQKNLVQLDEVLFPPILIVLLNDKKLIL